MVFTFLAITCILYMTLPGRQSSIIWQVAVLQVGSEMLPQQSSPTNTSPATDPIPASKASALAILS